MKRSELFFGALLIPVDLAMIILAGTLAYWLRFTSGIASIRPVPFDFPFDLYLRALFFISPFLILIFALEGLYTLKTTRTFFKEFLHIILATSVGLTFVILAIFFERDWFSSRFIILVGWFLAITFIASARYLVNLIQKLLLIYRGIGVHRLVLIGHNGFKEALTNEFTKHPELGYKIVAREEKIDLDNLQLIKKSKGIDEILVCNPDFSLKQLRDISNFCNRNRIDFKFVPTLLQTISTNFDIDVLLGEPIIKIKNTPLDGWGKIAKRIFDIVGSFIGIIMASPIMLATAIAIKLDSKGPIIFKNERVGHRGNFHLFKFRYMKIDFCTGKQNPNFKKALEFEGELVKTSSIRKGPLYKIKNDPRKTRVGNFIEKTSIDELPQLFNVFMGKLSLVGPRPHQPREVDQYEDWQKRTISIKPGVTGLAQVSGRSDLNFEDEAKLDIYYIENWSLWLDIQILFRTIFVLLKKRKN